MSNSDGVNVSYIAKIHCRPTSKLALCCRECVFTPEQTNGKGAEAYALNLSVLSKTMYLVRTNTESINHYW